VRDGEEPVVTAAWTVRLSAALAERFPEVPVRVTVEAPAFAEDAELNVIWTGVPGTRAGLPGERVTPVGRPLAWIVTEPLKPLTAVACKEKLAELPVLTERLAGDALRVKLALPPVPPLPPEPFPAVPPQPLSSASQRLRSTAQIPEQAEKRGASERAAWIM